MISIFHRYSTELLATTAITRDLSWEHSLGRYTPHIPSLSDDLTDSQQTTLLPPVFALVLYGLTTYLILPYYRHLRARSSYSLLPSSQSSANNPSLTTRLFSRIQTLVGTSKRRASLSSLLDEEELEEGFDNLSEEAVRGRNVVAVDSDAEGDRRLSRELEAGFRDSSDEEEEEGRGAGRR